MKQVKYLVAVSGGVDSVVLLHMLVDMQKHGLLVAHFDHGIRPDSADDARFVAGLAEYYRLPFFSQREELGANASEELARKVRYGFLRQIAAEHDATIVTAHHGDDVIETIAINISRGTGWRGVAVLGSPDIERLLTGMSKNEIYDYAIKHRLEWVEDSTNRSDKYLRNRLRAKLNSLEEATKQRLLCLYEKQRQLAAQIRDEEKALLTDATVSSRYFFSCVEPGVAAELLGMLIEQVIGERLLFEQLERGVMAIKTAAPKTIIDLGEGVELYFEKQSFVARRREKML